MNKLVRRLKALASTRKGKLILIAIAAAILGLLVAARRKSLAGAAGAPLTADQVAADPRSSGLGGTFADYGALAPYEGGSIGGGGFSGSDVGAIDYLDQLAGISEQLASIGEALPQQQTILESPTAPLQQTTKPAAAAPVKKPAKAAAAKPAHPQALTFTNAQGKVVPTAYAIATKQAKPGTQVGQKVVAQHPHALTFKNALGQIVPTAYAVATGNAPKPAPAPAPAAVAPKPAAPAAPAPAPKMTLQQAAAAYTGGARTFTDNKGAVRRASGYTAFLKSKGLA